MLISIWINMIVIPCTKKSTELIASHVCENILYEKSHSLNGKKKRFLKYRALFYHDELF